MSFALEDGGREYKEKISSRHQSLHSSSTHLSNPDGIHGSDSKPPNTSSVTSCALVQAAVPSQKRCHDEPWAASENTLFITALLQDNKKIFSLNNTRESISNTYEIFTSTKQIQHTYEIFNSTNIKHIWDIHFN